MLIPLMFGWLIETECPINSLAISFGYGKHYMKLFTIWPIKRAYEVFSPEYCTSFMSYGPPEPPEYSCDYITVFARSKRAAVIEGVKLILKTQSRSYATINRSDGVSPFAGYKATKIWLWNMKQVFYSGWQA